MNETQADWGKIGEIPVRNLWLLMLYASDCRHLLDLERVGSDENPDELPDLIGQLLARIVERRLARNLSAGYQTERKVLNRVRGRIDLLTTARKQLLAKGKVACRYDALTVNTPRNRYVRAALEQIAHLSKTPSLSHRCMALALLLKNGGVIGPKPSRAELSGDQIGRNDAQDRQMLALARLAFDMVIPAEEQGLRTLFAPEREEHWIRRLFEKATAGFFDVMLPSSEWRVRTGTKHRWPVVEQSDRMKAILPMMETDIILENQRLPRRIVIDTKFTGILKKRRYDKVGLKSGYLYQIYTYLRSQEREDDPQSLNSTGVLLHPAIGESIDEYALMQNHLMRFMTVDLTGTAAEIQEQLLGVVQLPDFARD